MEEVQRQANPSPDVPNEARPVEAGLAAPEPPLAPPPPPAQDPAPPPAGPIAPWPPPPVDATPDTTGATVKLWSAGDVGVISFLFGFPAGLGLAARNWYRMGRRPAALAHLVAGVVGLVLIMIAPEIATGLAALINIAVALYLYYRTRTMIQDATRWGLRVQRGGAVAGFATIVGAWIAMLGVSVLLATLALLAIPDTGAGDVPQATPSAAPAPSLAMASPSPAGTLTPSVPPRSAASTPDLGKCPSSVLSHQAGALEALLPKRLAGRDLTTWSVSGWCWLGMGVDEQGLAEIAKLVEDGSIDVSQLQVAVAGRPDTLSDPPYFVVAAARPSAADEAEAAVFFLLDGAGFKDPFVDLADYQPREVDGRTYFAGTPDMILQSEHQRGRPFLYQVDSVLFVIITDDDAWAEETIRGLPCCWSD